ncbi:MAG: hypothetical protein BWK73_36515 [Thiothrix lacustris]|uniref:TonB-dependent siderophore receptor n=1 Tax=Thiothrix lacustris TaxID=525917 RepID=A0A1Y1QFB5_9GAMM|nr:MAG: hypothetical protein BWK73_36515 [Thiothrix lacustris]
MLKRSALCLAVCSAFAPVASFADTPKPDVLDDITVTGNAFEQTTAGDVDGYQALTADSATKTRTPLKKIPQSVQVVPKKLMDDQQVQSVGEALKNVSGVVPNQKLMTPGWETTTVRGFAAEQLQDGSTLYYNMGDRESTVNMERIEVLKGANAVLHGGGSGSPVGGVVNLVSKMPQAEKFGKVGVTVGSHGLVKPSFDINQPLNAKAQLRVTGEYSQSESQVDVIERESYNLNPTLKLTPNDKTTLTLQGKTSRWEGQDYQGLPAEGTLKGTPIDRNLFIGNKDLPNSVSKSDSLAATVDHKLNDTWSVNAKVRSAKGEYDEKAQVFLFPMGGNTWTLHNMRMYDQQKDSSLDANLKGEFKTDKTKTTLVVGAESSKLDDKAIMDYDMMNPTTMADLSNPDFSVPYADPNTAMPWSGLVKNKTSGVYAQAQHSINDRVHLLGGAKLSKVDIDYQDNMGGDDKTSTTKLLPRAGVAVDVNDKATVFASYSEGLRGVPWANYTDAPKPVESKQTEAGVKFALTKQLSGSVAAYQIDRENTNVADPVTMGVTVIPDGAERSKGVDVDVVWQPTPALSVSANYANTDAKLTKAAGAVPAGNKLAGVPEHSGRIWGNYTFKQGQVKGVSLGAGVTAQSGMMLDSSNVDKIGASHTFDAKVGYENKRFETALTVKNLTNEKYFDRINYFSGHVTPGEDRTVYLSTAVKF